MKTIIDDYRLIPKFIHLDEANYENYKNIISQDEFNKIQKANPPHTDYTKWIVNQYQKIKTNRDKELFWEDLYKVTEALSIFTSLKNKNKIINKDIGQFKSIQELLSFTRQYKKEQPEEDLRSKSSRQEEGVSILFDDDTWKIAIPHTHEMSCKLGVNTDWCTAVASNDDYFNKYSKKGNLIIIINKETKEKYQFHKESGQFMDKEDNEISSEVYNKILKSLPKQAQEALKKEGYYNGLLKDIKNWRGTINQGNTDDVIKLLKKGFNPSLDDNYAIKWASEYGHIEIVKLLLADKRVDPSDNNNLAIRWASYKGHLEVVKLLLADKRVDPSAENNYAIRWASNNDLLEVVKLLLTDKRVYNKAIELNQKNILDLYKKYNISIPTNNKIPIIKETLDSVYPYIKDADSYRNKERYNFKTNDNINYEVDFDYIGSASEPTYEISFNTNDKHYTKEIFKVLSTIKHIIYEWLKEKQPEVFKFAIRKPTQARVNIYQRLANDILKTFPLYEEDEPFELFPDTKTFKFRKKQKNFFEGFKKYKLGEELNASMVSGHTPDHMIGIVSPMFPNLNKEGIFERFPGDKKKTWKNRKKKKGLNKKKENIELKETMDSSVEYHFTNKQDNEWELEFDLNTSCADDLKYHNKYYVLFSNNPYKPLYPTNKQLWQIGFGVDVRSEEDFNVPLIDTTTNKCPNPFLLLGTLAKIFKEWITTNKPSEFIWGDKPDSGKDKLYTRLADMISRTFGYTYTKTNEEYTNIKWIQYYFIKG